jgi:carbon-monoxide dehydrogenase large subunit
VLGSKLRLIADIGAYNMLLTAAIPTLTMLMANATYDFPAVRTTLTEVFTNKTPTDAYRGAGARRRPTSSSAAWTCWRAS